MSPLERLNISLDMRAIILIGTIAMTIITPAVSIVGFGLQIRQDVRINSSSIAQERAARVAEDAAIRDQLSKTQAEAKQVGEDFRRAQLVYCTGLKQANGGRGLPDANC